MSQDSDFDPLFISLYTLFDLSKASNILEHVIDPISTSLIKASLSPVSLSPLLARHLHLDSHNTLNSTHPKFKMFSLVFLSLFFPFSPSLFCFLFQRQAASSTIATTSFS